MAKLTVPSHDQVFPPESLQKKQKTQAANAAKTAEQKAASKKEQQEKRKIIFDRAAKYHQEYVAAERDTIAATREQKQQGTGFYVEAEPRLIFVVRVKGVNKIAPKPRKVLQLLRLHQINNGVFIRVTKATAEMLRIVEPYVAYGYPNRSLVRKLVYKRGYGKVNKQRIALSDNAIIEANLGQFGIICVEDLIHEIVTVGPHFKQASNFLWPFKLSNPSGGWGVDRKFKHFIEGGSTGNREAFINALVLRML